MITALAQMQSQKQLQNRSASQVIALDNRFPFTSLESGLFPIWHLSSFRPTMTLFVFPGTHLCSFMYCTYRSIESKWWFSFQLSLSVCLQTAASLLRKWEIIQNQHMMKTVLPFFLHFVRWPRETLLTATSLNMWILSKTAQMKNYSSFQILNCNVLYNELEIDTTSNKPLQ